MLAPLDVLQSTLAGQHHGPTQRSSVSNFSSVD